MNVSALRLWSVALSACLLCSNASADDETPRALTIEARNIALSMGQDTKSSIGKLVHRGTLRLTSPDTDFGGISGLIVSDDGSRFLAITDVSHWLTGGLQYRDNRLVGVTGSEIGPLLAPDGAILKGKLGDAEGLTGRLDGDVYISFEGKHRIWRYPYAREGLRAKPTVVATPTELSGAPLNGGLEGITLLNDGKLLALTESFHDTAGNIRGWVLETGVDPRPVLLKQRSPFDVTDVRQLENGDVLTLERRFSTFGGVGFQMRRVASPTFAAGQVLDGEVIADAGMDFMIDNMEALSVRKGANGETLVYLASDDNFNAPLQQTLIMMFELKN